MKYKYYVVTWIDGFKIYFTDGTNSVNRLDVRTRVKEEPGIIHGF